MPAVVLWNRHKFSPRTGTIHANALRVRAKMTPPGKTIATMTTGDVPLADYEIALCKSFHVIANGINNADKLVTNRHRHRNGFLRPRVPVVDVHVGPTDGSFQNPDEHLVAANFWDRNFLEPETGLGFGLHNGLHHFLHNGKLGQSGIQEKSFASGREFHSHSLVDPAFSRLSPCWNWRGLRCPGLARQGRHPCDHACPDRSIARIARRRLLLALFRPPKKSLIFLVDTASA